MTPREDYPALLRAQLLQSKSQVPRYWREADQKQRAAICYTAQLPFSFAKEVLPIGRADKESIRQAVIELGLQHLFHDRMSEYEWHTGCLPELQQEEEEEEEEEEEKEGRTGPAERLEKSKGLLMTLVNNPQTANSGQEKTPVNGARHA
ncbi:hypothetical protein [Aeromonas salmonicida]|uniref:hypothetical protein n=1 Tax=Aeromonas salmonicida TaxID=645 RepID=UPI00244DC37B|nr:hypothetical protein [Aeromonas salmonicida]WGI37815.1 hypothetical protein QDU35_15700 [Aeromonas salmonicida]HDN9511146.1 hypothetical protein [Aeromonas salmonicida]HDN9519331.1 hypothetical protein [Aeromonas salmonicida]